ncbi:hypothetical protein H5410_001233 [Solanum commersonii]|uniref:Uncharacterized protein n=1 Tax=Solanum commersonii TaxID=4109 RepID=A0A9J6AYJ4_SOLCO|nr:hypothetical protein H5410_001233 [Solanum commersonii]
MAASVGRPLQVDLATQNKTRPSCARVKVETGEIMGKWVTIKYDYVPKYCKTSKLQGHNEKDCYVIHPELFPQEEKKDEKEEKELA